MFFVLCFFAFTSLTTVDLFQMERKMVIREVRGECLLSQRRRPPSWGLTLLAQLAAASPTCSHQPLSHSHHAIPPAGGYYRPGAYLLAKMSLDALLLRVIPVFIFAAPFYPMVCAIFGRECWIWPEFGMAAGAQFRPLGVTVTPTVLLALLPPAHQIAPTHPPIHPPRACRWACRQAPPLWRPSSSWWLRLLGVGVQANKRDTSLPACLLLRPC